MVWRCKRHYNDKTLTLKKIYEYASERIASELGNFFAFSHSKTAISFNILLVILILYLRNIYIFRSQITSAYIIQSMQYTLLLLIVWRYVFKRQYTDKTLTLRKSMYMRASGASELRKFSNFYILKLLFLSIFCWYFRYFVGTNDMLVGLHVPTNCQMYRQNSEKHYGGGGAIAPPPPAPSGYANAPPYSLVPSCMQFRYYTLSQKSKFPCDTFWYTCNSRSISSNLFIKMNINKISLRTIWVAILCNLTLFS